MKSADSPDRMFVTTAIATEPLEEDTTAPSLLRYRPCNAPLLDTWREPGPVFVMVTVPLDP